MGGVEIIFLGIRELLVRYHSNINKILTLNREPVKGQFLMGSLTGAVAS